MKRYSRFPRPGVAVVGLFPLAALAFVAGPVTAAVPRMMNYQGYLRDGATHQPLSGNTFTLTFRLFGSATGQVDSLWRETHSPVTIDAGVFTVLLGSLNPLPESAFTGAAVWIETAVNSVRLAPRRPIVSVPYALHALRADVAMDTLWQTDGTNVYRLTGTVGVGTATPGAELGVFMLPSQTTAISSNAGYGSGVTGNYVANQFIAQYGSGSTGNLTGLKVDVSNTGSGQSNAAVFTGGNVGIGTTSPSYGLDVVGDIRATGTIYGNGNLTVIGTGGAGAFSTTGQPLGNGGGAGNLYFDHLLFSGTFGYGVADQYIQFDSNFNPSIGGQGAMAKLTAYRSPSGFDTGEGNLKVSLRSGSQLSDVLTLVAGGNVGIGTTSPSYRLDVAGDIRATGQIIGQVAGQVPASNVLPGAFPAGTYAFAGKVGIGTTSPGLKLSVAGPGQNEAALELANTDPGAGTWQILSGNSNQLNIWSNSLQNYPLSISANGWVGINTITPSSALQVVGDLTVNGNLTVSGTKCRVVKTFDGELKMNAVESAHALFMDDEPTARLVNGRCRVNLSPKFLATVTVNGKYPLAVNVTFYEPHGGEWYVQRDSTGFTVIDPSGSNAEFSWQAIARQRGYEDLNLEPVNQTAAKERGRT